MAREPREKAKRPTEQEDAARDEHIAVGRAITSYDDPEYPVIEARIAVSIRAEMEAEAPGLFDFLYAASPEEQQREMDTWPEELAAAYTRYAELAAEVRANFERGEYKRFDGSPITEFRRVWRDHHVSTLPQPRPRRRYKFSAKSPMQTAAEVKAISAMLADGRALRNFERLTGETALVHRRPSRHGLEFATKITAEGLTTWLGWPQTYEALERLVRESGVPAILAAHLVIGAVLEDGKATYALDDLIKEIGWTPHSSAERDKMRAQVWYWHVIWNSTPVIGARRRTYTDRDTHQKIPTVSREPLLLIRSTQLPEQRAFDATAVPLEVTMEAGEPLEAQRANPELRAVWGSVRKLSGIPGKQASGAWAQAIGLALFQRWREEASRAEVRRVGEDNHVTVKFAPFTRRQLLTLFPPDPTLDHVLSDQRQRRAVMYWNGAIKMLKKRKVIGFFQEPVFQPPSRQGWTDAWLDEPLDIRPTHEDMRNAEIIKRSALRIRKGAPRPRSAVPR